MKSKYGYKFGEEIFVLTLEGWRSQIFLNDGKGNGVVCVLSGYEKDFLGGTSYYTCYWDKHKKIPEKKYIPFTIEDAPFFRDKWIKRKKSNSLSIITYYNEKYIAMGGDWITFLEAFEQCEFEDGTPFGREVEQ